MQKSQTWLDFEDLKMTISVILVNRSKTTDLFLLMIIDGIPLVDLTTKTDLLQIGEYFSRKIILICVKIFIFHPLIPTSFNSMLFGRIYVLWLQIVYNVLWSFKNDMRVLCWLCRLVVQLLRKSRSRLRYPEGRDDHIRFYPGKYCH